jgi:hypothetical protein
LLIFRKFKNWSNWKGRSCFNESVPYIFGFLLVGSILALFVYDTAGNFYRTFYMNLLMAITNGIIFSFYSGKFRGVLKYIGIISFMVIFLSTLLSFVLIRSKILEGQTGPSISLQTNWKMLRSDIKLLKKECGISDNARKIFIDDMTYDALKSHNYLMPITYFDLTSSIVKKSNLEQQQARNFLFRRLLPTAAIMRCDYFFSVGLKPTSKIKSICCANFGN